MERIFHRRDDKGDSKRGMAILLLPLLASVGEKPQGGGTIDARNRGMREYNWMW